tara:strand:+ start:29 stop:169 length:141 start_codon:yes stop_codon:yes gene_type:complete
MTILEFLGIQIEDTENSIEEAIELLYFHQDFRANNLKINLFVILYD